MLMVPLGIYTLLPLGDRELRDMEITVFINHQSIFMTLDIIPPLNGPCGRIKGEFQIWAFADRTGEV